MNHNSAGALIAGALRIKSAKGLADCVANLVASGDLSAGTKLPTVRDLALQLSLSQATISTAWKTLVSHGVLETRRRGGTFIADTSLTQGARLFRGVVDADIQIDMSSGYPDPNLLPDLRKYLPALAGGDLYSGYPDQPVDKELQLAIEEISPYQLPALSLGTDVLTTLVEVLSLISRFGDKVLVGEAEFAPYLEIAQRVGLTPLPVPMDDSGPILSAVEARIAEGAKVILLQPRVHNPTGIVTTPERLAAIAKLCVQAEVWIIESDHFGKLATSAPISAGTTAPERTIYLRSFAKDVHPDVRVIAIGAPKHIIDRLENRRVGGGWISRMNQDLLRILLRSPEVLSVTEAAKVEYDRRRGEFIATLRDAGIEVSSRDGLNLWIPVTSESAALISLASRGIGASPGSAFHLAKPTQDHLRVSISTLSGNVTEVATLVANAAKSHRASGAIHYAVTR
jgi:DNA-binding transcriptional MocR family regulator